MKKRMSALMLATAMTVSAVTPAMAAKTHPIKEVKIEITTSGIEAGSDDWSFDVVCETPHTYFDDYEDVTVTNAPEDGEAWSDDIKPKATIKIYADTEDDYYFKTSEFDKDNVKVYVDEVDGDSESANFSYKVSDKSSSITVTVTLDELDYPEDYWETALELEDFDWDYETALATWSENENANYYEYKLYRGSTALTSVEKTENTELDLAQYFTRKGEYKLRVRAVYDSKKRGEWVDETIDVDAEEAEDIYANASTTSGSASTSKPSNGPSTSTSVNLPSYVVKGNWGTKNGKWTFTDNKGVAYKNKWAAVYNPYANVAAGQQAFDWFYFDKNGEMVTGWILDGGLYYYCSPLSDGTQGRMVTGWFQIDGAWYYFNPVSDGTRGAMQVNKWIGNDYVGANGKFEKSR